MFYTQIHTSTHISRPLSSLILPRVTCFGAADFPPHPLCCPFLAGGSRGGHTHSRSLPVLSPGKGCSQQRDDKTLSPSSTCSTATHKKKSTQAIPIYRPVLCPGLTGTCSGLPGSAHFQSVLYLSHEGTLVSNPDVTAASDWLLPET